MKNTLTTLLLVLICGVATAQMKISTETQSNDSFAAFMDKKSQVSFLQPTNSGTCESQCIASFRICLTFRPTSVCYREINQCLAPCP